MMRVQKLALTAVASLGAFLASGPPANAAVTHVNACPSLETELCKRARLSNGGLVGVAVDNSSEPSAGDVWGVYYNPQRLIGYDASGEQLIEVSLERGVLGSADIAREVAVDPSNGDVYLASDEHESGGFAHNDAAEITRFDSSGAVVSHISGSETPQGSFGYVESVAFDPSTGDVYVADSGREAIDKFTAEGVFVEQLSLPTSGRFMESLAVGPEGDMYVGLSGSEPEGGETSVTTQVSEYSPGGAPVDCPGASNVVYESSAAAPDSVTVGAVAVDPSDGHLFISERSESEGNYIAEYAGPCTAPLDTFGAGELGVGAGRFEASRIEAIGVDGSTNTVYLTSGGSATGGPIFKPAVVPDVTTGTPAKPEHVKEALSGTVNPDETSVTECEFEYGGTFAYGHSVPCAQSLPLEGSSPITVSAELQGLTPDTPYHYRLRAGNADGHRVGGPQTFTTEPFGAPLVGGLPASLVSQFAATLNGTIATGEALVGYHFEYGTTTSYGQVEPVPDALTAITGETVAVAQPVSGLHAGTTYHYRLVASSPGGTEVSGPDETFTTLPVPAPTALTGGAGEVGVGSATLAGTLDPYGWDTTYLFEYGTSTAYGQSWPTIPVDMGALEGPQPVVVTVPNLLPGTIYHYRLVAFDGGGVSYGQDMTFTTGEYPASVVQEPVALRTLFVPSELGKITTTTPKAKKKSRKRKKRTGRGSGKKRRKTG